MRSRTRLGRHLPLTGRSAAPMGQHHRRAATRAKSPAIAPQLLSPERRASRRSPLHRHALDIVRQDFAATRVHDDVHRLDLRLLHQPRRVCGIVRPAFMILLTVADRKEARAYAPLFAEGCLARITTQSEPWALTTIQVRNWLKASRETRAVETAQVLPIEVEPAARYHQQR